MEGSKMNNLIRSLALASIVSAIFVTLITILGELVSPVKSFLAEQHHHHWVGKGIWTVVLFAVISFVHYVAKMKRLTTTEQVSRSIMLLGHVLILSAVILFVFFLYEYAIHH